jgi:hypothetical protein
LRSLPFAAGKAIILAKFLSSALCHIEYRTDYSDFDAFNLRFFTLRGRHAISIMSSAQYGLLTTFSPLTNDSFPPLAIDPTSLQNKMFRPGIRLCSPIFTAVGSGNCVLVVVDAKDSGVIKLVRHNTQTNSISVRDLPFPSSTRYSIKSIALDDHLGILYILMGRNIVSLAFS